MPKSEVLTGNERKRYWEILQLVIKKKTFCEMFKNKYPEMYKIVNDTKKEN
jgi:hypothetical protein